MTTGARLGILAGIIAAAIVVLIVAGAGGDEENPPPTTTTPAQTEASTTTQSTTTETTAKPAGPPTYRVTVRGGQPVGGVKEIEVDKGDTVRLVVRSDSADHVHIHGYDLMQDVGPGKTARFRFKATSDGAYEIELEQRALQIAELKVQP